MPTRSTTTTIRTRTIPRSNGFAAVRPAVLGLCRLLALSFQKVAAAPLAGGAASVLFEHGDGDDPDLVGTALYVYLGLSVALVLTGGIFAGLTIALMGQDSIYLQVLSSDHSEPQHNNARRVLKLLDAGKHWVLVTLLLSNVVVNESLPVVLDRCLGGGVAAIVGSTVLIVIFGEVVPQSVCVRYGLQIGGYMSKPVLALMWLTSPISWPMAKLLDWVLGEDHGTVYKKSGLKTLVTLHRSLGVASERLNKDEVTIISAVLDLKEKPVAAVMTPMEDVFVMSEDTVLDEQTMDKILSAGYSRIPIHEAGNPTNFLGMLLVKILITYDPEDCNRVKDFPLATLPETRPETSCLDIVNYFQEGKSHMVLVSDSPGNPFGAIGVVTLEDVIEELIGEEIVDESDVYIDVHKAIRRLHPAPNAQMWRRQSVGPPVSVPPSADPGANGENGGTFAPNLKPLGEPIVPGGSSPAPDAALLSSSPKATTATFMMRRSSAGIDGKMVSSAVPVRHNFEELKEHLKHLGPSNPATNPKNTRLSTVTIKPGIGGTSPHPRSGPVSGEIVHDVIHEPSSASGAVAPAIQIHRHPTENGDDDDADNDNERTALLRSRPPLDTPKDGVQALRQSYGSASATEAQQHLLSGTTPPRSHAGPGAAIRSISADVGALPTLHQGTQIPTPSSRGSSTILITDSSARGGALHHAATAPAPGHGSSSGAAGASSSGGSSPASEGHGSGLGTPLPRRSTTARSGSITENIIESRGFRKVVLETTGSAAEEEELPSTHVGRARGGSSPRVSDVDEEEEDGGGNHVVVHDDDDDDDEYEGRHSNAGVAASGSVAGEASHGAGQSGGGGGGGANHKRKNRRKKRKGKS